MVARALARRKVEVRTLFPALERKKAEILGGEYFEYHVELGPGHAIPYKRVGHRGSGNAGNTRPQRPLIVARSVDDKPAPRELYSGRCKHGIVGPCPICNPDADYEFELDPESRSVVIVYPEKINDE